MRYGFTLVELAIVLVIIGLLVGGVLVGQDLIRASAIRATIGQVDKFNAAANTFRGKYGGLPGDLTLTCTSTYGFFTTGLDGSQGKRDGNSLIESSTTTNAHTLTNPVGETMVYWRDLSDAALIDGVYGAGLANAGALPGNQTAAQGLLWYPPAKLRDGTLFIVYSLRGKNYYQLIASIDHPPFIGPASGGTYYYTDGITPTEAYAMDSKIDDGAPLTGSVFANANNGAVYWWGDPPVPPDGCVTAAPVTYDIGTANKDLLKCTISFVFN